MSKLKIVITSVMFLVLMYLGFATDFFRSDSVHDFESCIAYGNIVMESFPRKCTGGGVTYVETIVAEDKGIQVSDPTDQATLTSPISIRGEAKGKWFFEGSFPVSLVDESGKSLVESHVTAEGDWMTEDFVPFTANISFSVATTTKGFVVFKNDNPSGDATRDVHFKIPVTFVPKTNSLK
jgi:hypothetical protein